MQELPASESKDLSFDRWLKMLHTCIGSTVDRCGTGRRVGKEGKTTIHLTDSGQKQLA